MNRYDIKFIYTDNKLNLNLKTKCYKQFNAKFCLYLMAFKDFYYFIVNKTCDKII